MKKALSTLLLVITLILTSNGQQPSEAANPAAEAMKSLQWLTGSWKGTGSIQMGPQKRSFNQTEKVTAKMNGTVIMIDGLGVDASTGNVVHQAFAIISYDAFNKKYLIRAFLANGNYVDGDISVDPDGSVIWGYRYPSTGQMRYTITNDSGHWHEKGEMNRDGSTWIPFFGMELTRQ